MFIKEKVSGLHVMKYIDFPNLLKSEMSGLPVMKCIDFPNDAKMRNVPLQRHEMY